MGEHTPGPWARKPAGFRIWQKSRLHQERAGFIAEASISHKTTKETDANAALIAAAPETAAERDSLKARVEKLEAENRKLKLRIGFAAELDK